MTKPRLRWTKPGHKQRVNLTELTIDPGYFVRYQLKTEEENTGYFAETGLKKYKKLRILWIYW